MKRLLLGLALSTASAWCTTLPPSMTPLLYPVPFTTYLHPVTDVNTPEWARLTDVFAWWELQLGTFPGSAVTTVLRGLLLKDGHQNYSLVQWLESFPTLLGLNDGATGTENPEPGTFGLAAVVLAALYWRHRHAKHRSPDELPSRDRKGAVLVINLRLL